MTDRLAVIMEARIIIRRYSSDYQTFEVILATIIMIVVTGAMMVTATSMLSMDIGTRHTADKSRHGRAAVLAACMHIKPYDTHKVPYQQHD